MIVFTLGIYMCEEVSEDLRQGESHSHPWHVDI